MKTALCDYRSSTERAEVIEKQVIEKQVVEKKEAQFRVFFFYSLSTRILRHINRREKNLKNKV